MARARTPLSHSTLSGCTSNTAVSLLLTLVLPRTSASFASTFLARAPSALRSLVKLVLPSSPMLISSLPRPLKCIHPSFGHPPAALCPPPDSHSFVLILTTGLPRYQRLLPLRGGVRRSPLMASPLLLFLLLLLSVHCSFLFSSRLPALHPPLPSVDWSAVRVHLRTLMEGEEGRRLSSDGGSAGPLFVLLAWHSAASFSAEDGRGGTDGAGVRFPPESEWPSNGGLHSALDLLEGVRSLHSNASLADLLALAGGVAVEAMEGPHIAFHPGRAHLPRHPLPLSTPSRIPQGNFNLSSLLRAFHSLSLSPREGVALIGAHSIGRCHPHKSGYDGKWSRRPTTFSNEFFRGLTQERWSRRQWSGPTQWINSDSPPLLRLPSDLALMEGEETRRWVEVYANNEDTFRRHFTRAFTKLMDRGVGGGEGEGGRGGRGRGSAH